MSGSKLAGRRRALSVAAVALALLVSACGSSSKSTSSPNSSSAPGTSASGLSPSTTSGGAASAQVDLTASGALTFHITGTKALCNGSGSGVDLTAADYPEVGNDLSIGSFNGGAPSFKWLFSNDVIYANNAATDAAVTFTLHPFTVVLKSAKLVAAVAIGTPAKPGVTLTGTITCPG